VDLESAFRCGIMGSPVANINSDDYYEVLGVARRASEQEIKTAYRQMALKFHPDKNPDDVEAARAKFTKISEAYETLHDSEKRKAYDQFGKEGASRGFHGQHPGGMSGGMSHQQADDLFRTFFGSDSFGGGMPGGMPSGMRGGVPGGLPGGFQFNFPQAGGFGGGPGFGGSEGLGGNVFGGNMFGGGMSQPDFLGGMRGGQPSQQPSPPYCLPKNTGVVIHGLTTAFEHNGKSGTAVSWDAQRCRYNVKLQSGETISLRSQNLVQRCRVEVIGIQSKPGMNGKAAEVFAYDDQKCRYSVLVENPATTMALQAENCLLKQGTAVTLKGLSDQSLNGMMAQIIAVDRVEAKYTVQCQSGRQIRVKLDKVLF